MSDSVVLFEELATANGKKIGVATLNSEKSLNSLSLPMVELLGPKLSEWQANSAIAAVFLQGAGDKSFCAGGDVVALYHGSAAYGEALTTNFCEEFFTKEYQLDYQIHTFGKPFIVWGNGIVMGGGMGLLSGASHRVVTETTRMAMPEIGIGLYPDVGGTWFLNHAPGNTGLFLGLTGASINAADAIYIGFADHFITHDQKASVLTALAGLTWSGDSASDQALVDQLMVAKEGESLAQQPVGNVESHLEWINTVAAGDTLAEVVAQITNTESDDKWVASAVKSLQRGCPITPYLVWEQLNRGADLALNEVFKLELIMSTNCAKLGHFKEGVRALLIDKDRSPQWQPSAFSAVTPADVDAHFMAPWSGDHPLKDL
jgi:enoyl-CoA hydratase/carnithine racemase